MLAHIGGTPWLRVRQVLRTGSTAGWDEHLVDEQDDEPEPDDEPGTEQMTIEEFVLDADHRQMPYSTIVRTLVRDWQISESTAKRAIRQARAGRQEVTR
jgi:hypothetical protein